MHSPDHSTKGTPSALTRPRQEWPLTAGAYGGSGSLSSPSRGAFHLSLTVLVRYRSLNVFSLGEWSPQLPTRFRVSHGTQDTRRIYPGCPLRDFHPLWFGIPAASRDPRDRVASPTTPTLLAKRWFGLFPVRSPLLRESRLISFRRATEMFQFTRFPPPCLCVQQGVSRHDSGWVAPFGSVRIFACVQLPLRVSPVSASFIGIERQGIHPVRCVACSRSEERRVGK